MKELKNGSETSVVAGVDAAAAAAADDDDEAEEADDEDDNTCQADADRKLFEKYASVIAQFKVCYNYIVLCLVPTVSAHNCCILITFSSVNCQNKTIPCRGEICVKFRSQKIQ